MPRHEPFGGPTRDFHVGPLPVSVLRDDVLADFRGLDAVVEGVGQPLPACQYELLRRLLVLLIQHELAHCAVLCSDRVEAALQ